MTVENIYIKTKSANNFVKSIQYNLLALREIAKFTYEYFKQNKIDSIKILDIGIGSGALTIPILEYLESKKNLSYHLDCFDISESMLSHLEKNLSIYPSIKQKVNYIKKDAEEGLLNYYDKSAYDLIIITFVLHYIKKWKRLLRDVFKCLKNGGIFLQAEIIGDLRNVDGKFDTDSPKIFEQFWKKYFSERSKYSNWEPLISVSDLSVVLKYCLEKFQFKVFKEKKFLWKTNIIWEDLLDWIKCAPVSSLGSNLSDSERAELSIKMYNWLKENKVDPNSSINLKWGFKVIWLVKN